VAAADVGSAVIEFEVAPPTYVFEEGKLSKVWMRLGPFAENFRFLTEKYGNPAIQNQEPVLTPYGTTWQLVRAEWHMPDGAVIRAWESIVRTRPLNIAALETLTRVTSIEFSSKEEIERVKSKEARKPNPLN